MDCKDKGVGKSRTGLSYLHFTSEFWGKFLNLSVPVFSSIIQNGNDNPGGG